MKKTLNQFPTISQMKEKIETYGKNIKNLEEQIELERNRKLTTINQLVSFCDDVLAWEYFKIGEKVIKIGQIENFFYKSGKFFVRVSLIDITVNSKVMKVFKNLGKMSETLDNSIFEMKAKKCFNNKMTC